MKRDAYCKNPNGRQNLMCDATKLYLLKGSPSPDMQWQIDIYCMVCNNFITILTIFHFTCVYFQLISNRPISIHQVHSFCYAIPNVAYTNYILNGERSSTRLTDFSIYSSSIGVCGTMELSDEIYNDCVSTRLPVDYAWIWGVLERIMSCHVMLA